MDNTLVKAEHKTCNIDCIFLIRVTYGPINTLLGMLSSRWKNKTAKIIFYIESIEYKTPAQTDINI